MSVLKFTHYFYFDELTGFDDKCHLFPVYGIVFSMFSRNISVLFILIPS